MVLPAGRRWLSHLVIAFGLSVTWILFALLAGIAPELRGVVMHLGSRKYGRRYSYVLSDQGINVRTRLTNLDVAWDAITRCRESARHWIMRFPGGGLLHVPKHALTPTDTLSGSSSPSVG